MKRRFYALMLLVTFTLGGLGYWAATHRQLSANLPDGTEAIYYWGTDIMPHDDFAESREVTIDGEAFLFIPAADKPMTIYTRLMVVTVIGETAMRINAFADKTGEQIDVLKGRVLAKKSYESRFNETADMESGEMVMINSTIDLMEEEIYDAEELHKWNAKFDLPEELLNSVQFRK